MSVKLFILGRPGSGKSTASYLIAGLAWEKGWSVVRIRDYEILWRMYQADTEHKQFYPAQYNGFDVLDFSVLDTALEEVEKRAQRYTPFEDRYELIIIEFARDDYGEALKLFSRDFLQSAHFLFIETDVETCIERIYKRVAHHRTADDNFVSDYVLRNYYHKDNRRYILAHLRADCGTNKQIEIIDNTGSLHEFIDKVRRFAAQMFEQEM